MNNSKQPKSKKEAGTDNLYGFTVGKKQWHGTTLRTCVGSARTLWV